VLPEEVVVAAATVLLVALAELVEVDDEFELLEPQAVRSNAEASIAAALSGRIRIEWKR
jgi:hypothetical protein